MEPWLSISRIKQLEDLKYRFKSVNIHNIHIIHSWLYPLAKYILIADSLGIPETSFNGRKTRIARSVRRFSPEPSCGNSSIMLITTNHYYTEKEIGERGKIRHMK